MTINGTLLFSYFDIRLTELILLLFNIIAAYTSNTCKYKKNIMVNYILLLGQSHNWLFLIDLNMGLYKRYYIMCSCKVCTNVHTQNQLFYIHRLMLKPKLVI